MKTITSENSLLLFAQNRNRSNIFPEDELFLTNEYGYLFDRISAKIKDSSKPQLSIVKLWKEECENACERVAEDLKRISASKEDIEKVVNKFRGNAGEIFVEMMMENGYCVDICQNGSYVPVEDPHHERFIDGKCISPIDELPSGIQIKNYRANLVSQEIFQKAAAEAMLWIQHDRIILREEILRYLKSPHQYVISFTDSNSFSQDDYNGVVVFLGPDWIDGKGIQGDWKRGIPGNYKMFERVSKEINDFWLKHYREIKKTKQINETPIEITDLTVEVAEPVAKKPKKEIECDIFHSL